MAITDLSQRSLSSILISCSCCITGDDSKLLTGGQDGRVLVIFVYMGMICRFGMQKQCKCYENIEEAMLPRKQ